MDQESLTEYGELNCSCDAVAEFMAYAHMTGRTGRCSGAPRAREESSGADTPILRGKEESIRGSERG